MGLIKKVISKVVRVLKRQPCAKKEEKPVPPARFGPDTSLFITTQAQACSAAEITDKEVTAVASRFAFVPANDLAQLDAVDQWWDMDLHQHRLLGGDEKRYAWLEPFLPVDLVKREQLKSVLTEWGPLDAPAVAKELRGMIRTRRMHKQPYADLLRALYGACVMADFVESLRFEGGRPEVMVGYVDLNELRTLRIDYASLGYRCIGTLGKTDREWMVEAFGEPAAHQTFQAAFPVLWQNLISRFYWAELRAANNAARELGRPIQSLRPWARWRVRNRFGVHSGWPGRIWHTSRWEAAMAAARHTAWMATSADFVVADLAAIAPAAGGEQRLEIAALRVGPSGQVLAEFAAFIESAGVVPAISAKSAGQAAHRLRRVQQEDADPRAAMASFLKFVGSLPVFLHNAPYNVNFLKSAALKAGKEFGNPMHDTVPLAHAAWPALGSCRMDALMQYLGMDTSFDEGALSGAKATLAVLLASRKAAKTADGHATPESAFSQPCAPLSDFHVRLSLSGEHAIL